MLMLPSPITSVHSKYSSPCEPGIRFALDLTDSPPDMDGEEDLQQPKSQSNIESFAGLSETSSSLGISR
jgi:hypothetical protein